MMESLDSNFAYRAEHISNMEYAMSNYLDWASLMSTLKVQSQGV